MRDIFGGIILGFLGAAIFVITFAAMVPFALDWMIEKFFAWGDWVKKWLDRK